jgi:Acyltransferase
VLLGRLLLVLCFGVPSVSSTMVRLRRGVRGASPTLPSTPDGALILCNHVSALDLFILHVRFSPVFALPSGSGSDPDDTRYCARTWLGALFSLRGDHVSSANSASAQPLAEIQRAAQKQGRPVVVFVEGATSNGSLVLGCSALDPQCLQGNAPAPAVVTLTYESPHSPTLGTRRFSAHLFWDLLATLRHPVTVRHLHPDDFPQEMQGEQMLDALAGCARLRRGKQLPNDKLTFLAYWRSHH